MAAWHTHLRLCLWRCTSHPTWQVKIRAYKDPGEDLLRFSHLLGFQCLFTTWLKSNIPLPSQPVFHRKKNRKVLWNLIGAKHPKFCGFNPKTSPTWWTWASWFESYSRHPSSYLLRWFRGPVFGWYKFVGVCSHTGCRSFSTIQSIPWKNTCQACCTPNSHKPIVGRPYPDTQCMAYLLTVHFGRKKGFN